MIDADEVYAAVEAMLDAMSPEEFREYADKRRREFYGGEEPVAVVDDEPGALIGGGFWLKEIRDEEAIRQASAERRRDLVGQLVGVIRESERMESTPDDARWRARGRSAGIGGLTCSVELVYEERSKRTQRPQRKSVAVTGRSASVASGNVSVYQVRLSQRPVVVANPTSSSHRSLGRYLRNLLNLVRGRKSRKAPWDDPGVTGDWETWSENGIVYPDSTFACVEASDGFWGRGSRDTTLRLDEVQTFAA